MLIKTAGFISIKSLCILSLGGILFFSIPCVAEKYIGKKNNRININLNSEWLFCPQNITNGQMPVIDESGFKKVCLPHSVKIVRHSGIDTSSFAIISWYRKHIIIPQDFKNRRVSIEFQGVSKVADVFVNNNFVGAHKGAYTQFSFDITRFLKFGENNIIAVRVDSRQHKEIPPEGKNVDYMIFGGIVRDVSLIVTDPVHIDNVFVYCNSSDSSLISARIKVINNSHDNNKCRVSTFVVDTADSIVATGYLESALASDTVCDFNYTVSPVVKPELWHPDNPYLYKVYTTVECNGKCVDEYRVGFGIRTISFNKTDGKFYINGKRLMLRGLNRHETYPFIGRAAANRLQRKDADILKYKLGCNIVRCSHYPQDPEFLDQCDKIGLMVLEEMPGWYYVSKSEEWRNIAVKNVEEMITRDRNHPSIISFGVRINESLDYHDLYEKTNSIARVLDPTRPVHGVRVLDRGSPLEFIEDLWAQNFKLPDSSSSTFPWITTECVGHNFRTHSWDNEDKLIRQMLAFASVFDSAMNTPKLSGIIGWTSFDYNSPYGTAENQICYHGVSDIFRIPKFAAYFMASQASPSVNGPMVYIADYWKKTALPHYVWVVGNCDSVELFVNGVSMGKKSPDMYMHLEHPLFLWKAVKFVPGELKAVGYLGSSIAATYIRKTPGKPVRLLIMPDDTVLSKGGDMTHVVVSAVDASGQIVPQSKNIVSISVDGAGEFIGENPVSLENGETAFYIKTSSRTGVVSCKAKSGKLAETEKKIVVQ
jgi:beta-galactosidase